MNTSAIIFELYAIGAIKLGEFTLKSGKISPIYIDLRLIVSYPTLLRAVSNALWEKIADRKFDIICGIPYTALPIATCMSLEKNIPMILRRKEKKSYGTQQILEGNYQTQQTCLIIEDVITSGASVLETTVDIEAAELIVKDIAVFIDREQGGRENLQNKKYAVHAALTLTEILTTLLDSNVLGNNERALINSLTIS
jgi:orotate phosphoribosyltransferase